MSDIKSISKIKDAEADARQLLKQTAKDITKKKQKLISDKQAELDSITSESMHDEIAKMLSKAEDKIKGMQADKANEIEAIKMLDKIDAKNKQAAQKIILDNLVK